MAEIVMPRLSDTMEEGTILRWLKGDGELVARGSELVEIETDKAAMTYESDQEGVLEIVAPEGATLAIGELIARIGPTATATAEPSTNGQRAADVQPQPQPAPAPEQPVASEAAPAAQQAPVPARAQAPAQAAAAPGTGRIRASPLARRLARESGIDLAALSGSGPGGRIVRADVLGAGGGASAPARAAPAPAAAPAGDGQAAVLEGVATAKGETTVVELTRTQATIARRMAESKATIPDFELQIDVDMEGCVALRSELGRLAAAHGGATGTAAARAPAVPTYNDMIVKAAALALREHPRANGSYRDGQVQIHSRINVGVAVAAQDALIVPTVFDADEKSLGEIARETGVLVERVRGGTITPPELGGGTFTVSNLGMYGIRSFTAIINPPQAAILSVGELQPRAVADGEQVGVRRMLTLTLACDHRILYGADAALFLARIRELLQTPTALTL
ncbi:MAG TPA: dihydrolipoamide acetyltransferase family protein [Solirubrobacteraceae bacterium]|nr:dihydrolipoamide acetyltransferase family protein [Solirubrobacteraceae bacterium]